MPHRPPTRPVGKYIIERRYIGSDPAIERDWRLWKRYLSFDGCQRALRQLQADSEWEYRYR